MRSGALMNPSLQIHDPTLSGRRLASRYILSPSLDAAEFDRRREDRQPSESYLVHVAKRLRISACPMIGRIIKNLGPLAIG
jgi:hypothetical protein